MCVGGGGAIVLSFLAQNHTDDVYELQDCGGAMEMVAILLGG